MDKIDFMNAKEIANGFESIYKLISDTCVDAYAYYNYINNEFLVSDTFKKMFVSEKLDSKSAFKDFYENMSKNDVLAFNLKNEQAILNHEKSFIFDFFYLKKEIWVRITTNLVYDFKGNVVEQMAFYKDVSTEMEQKEQLEYWAYCDYLTGLYNRNYLYSFLDMKLLQAEKNNKKIHLMYVDIDDFKKINDSFGFEYGDELVLKFSQILAELSSEDVVVARFNSDEFVICLYDMDMDYIEYIYETIKKRTLNTFVLANGISVYITVSIGVVEYPKDGKTSADLIGNADIAMYNVKENGKNGICYFEKDMVSNFLQNVRIEALLKKAIDDNLFELYYQPQFDVSDDKLRGFEALIRWNDGAEGFISPGQFIPLAEKNGSIIQIGDWVIRQALNDYSVMSRQFGFEGIMSINISAIQFKTKGFENDLINIIRLYGIDPTKIELEITESTFIGVNKDVIERISKLRKFGFKISLDDFGTGYSSLSYLKDIPIDTLKIDKTFVDNMIDEETTSIITSSIVSMVQKLGLETIAEGVETVEQLEYLKKINCMNIQGFLLGRPMPFDEACKIIV